MKLSAALFVASIAVTATLGGSTIAVQQSGAPDAPQGYAQVVSVGYWHNCAVTREKVGRCWGEGFWGALGTGTRESWSLPAKVRGLSLPVRQIVAGEFHSCGLSEDGTVKCWGGNAVGQLGIGSRRDKSLWPRLVNLDRPAIELSALSYHTCVLLDDGTVRCWGSNDYHQLGPEATAGSSRTPLPVSGLPRPATSVSAGGESSCAILDDDSLWCWGRRIGPQPQFLMADVAQVSVGSMHGCLVTMEGAAYCWGSNSLGSVGDGTRTYRSQPVPVSGLSSGVTRVEAGNGLSCALRSDGTVKCWGLSGVGEWGAPTHLTPAPVIGLSDVQFLDAGENGACAITELGETRCWTVTTERIVAQTVRGLQGPSIDGWQPDLQIATGPSKPRFGVGVHNSNGLDQTREVPAQVGERQTFTITLRNDGEAQDLVFPELRYRSGLARLSCTFNGRDVTDDMLRSDFWVRLSPAQTARLVLTARATEKASPRGRIDIHVLAHSAHNPEAVDMVRAILRVVGTR